MGRLRILGFSAALVLTLAGGAALILAGSGVLPVATIRSFLDTTAASIVAIVLGVLFLLIAAHYAVQLVDDRINAAMFHQDGLGGRIDVSPAAIREFIAGVLDREIGLERFRVFLRHDGQGVRITVRTTLTPDQRVTDVGEQIQRQLSSHVTDRTGVEVTAVRVFVRGIRKVEPMASEAEGDAD